MSDIMAIEVAPTLDLPPIAAQSLRDPDPVVKVLAFHHLYGMPIQPFGNPDPTFSHMDNERVAFRLSLHIEEFKELLEKGFGIVCEMKFAIPFPVEGNPSPSVVVTEDIRTALDMAERVGIPRNGKEVMDALGDLNYVDTGMAIEMGYDPRPVMAEIHASNMTKLGEDGKPIINGVTVGYRDGTSGLVNAENFYQHRFEPEPGFDETARVGKVLKGPNYVEPNIAAALGWED